MFKLLLSALLGLLSLGLYGQELPLWFEESFQDNVNRWDDDYFQTPIELKTMFNTFAFGQGDCRFYADFEFRGSSKKEHLLILWGDKSQSLLFGINGKGEYQLRFQPRWRIDFGPNQWENLPAKALNKGVNRLEILQIGAKIQAKLNGQSLGSALPLPPRFEGKDLILGHAPEDKLLKFAIHKKVGPINVAESVRNLKAERQNLGPQVNSVGMEKRPFISPDGQNLYFLRERKRANGGIIQDIWYSRWDEAKKDWTLAQDIGAPINNESNNFMVAALPDNNTLAVINAYDAYNPDAVIAFTQRQANGRWSKPLPIEVKNNLKQGRWLSLHLAADGKTLMYAVRRHDGYGGRDIYVCFRQADGRFSEPLNLGPDINTSGNEHCPFLAADGKTLYFDTDGHPGYGGRDIFVSRRLDETWTKWSKPENLGPIFNSADSDEGFMTSAQGDYAYVVSSREALGELDIFRIKIPEALRPEATVLLRGQINCPRVQGSVALGAFQGDKLIALANSNPETGFFQFTLAAGEPYELRCLKDCVLGVKEVDLRGISRYEVKELGDWACGFEPPVTEVVVPKRSEEAVLLPQILFATASASLLPEAREDLRRLAALLKREAGLNLELIGHTDYRNTIAYNEALSKRRVEAVRDFLIAEGIEAKRLKLGYRGELEPRLGGQDRFSLAYNRRVELRLWDTERAFEVVVPKALYNDF